MVQDLDAISQLPTRAHPLGTDALGRDMLSRILWGAQTTLVAVIVVVGISSLIGAMVGGLSAYVGGYLDSFLTWLTTGVMTIPSLLLATLVDFAVREPAGSVFESLYQMTHWKVFATGAYANYLIVFAALSFVAWPHFALLLRGQILQLRKTDFVLAARAVGVPPRRVMIRHLLPNALGPLLVAASLSACDIVMLEGGLSYLGIGIKPPAASWGGTINTNLGLWGYRPHLVFVPALVLALTAIGWGLLGNGLSDALDPRRSNTR